jgi:thiol:disulfide interchange protein
MAQIDRSAVRTPMNFIAVLVILLVLRLGIQAASATVHEEARPTAWKTATDADKDLLPGAEDIKENATVERPMKSCSPQKPKEVFASIPLSDKDKQDIENGKLVLYEFVSDWSDPCRSMERNALSNGNISQIIETKFVPVRISDRMREAGKNPKWIANLQKRYHIFALPTLVVVDSQGEQKAALIGNCSSLTVERFLNRVKQ